VATRLPEQWARNGTRPNRHLNVVQSDERIWVKIAQILEKVAKPKND